MANDNGFREASFIGFGFGTFLGGMVAGSLADFLALPIHTMLAYCIGAVAGGFVGMLAGRVAAATLSR